MDSCRRAARLVSEPCDRDLSLAERALLPTHLFFCKMCSAYSKQFELMRKITRDLQNEQGDGAAVGLPTLEIVH